MLSFGPTMAHNNFPGWLYTFPGSWRTCSQTSCECAWCVCLWEEQVSVCLIHPTPTLATMLRLRVTPWIYMNLPCPLLLEMSLASRCNDKDEEFRSCFWKVFLSDKGGQNDIYMKMINNKWCQSSRLNGVWQPLLSSRIMLHQTRILLVY